MGLFDKLKTSDSEEVELQPPAETALARERTRREDDGGGDTGEDDGGEFILPGMSASAEEESSDTGTRTGSSTRSRSTPGGTSSQDELLQQISEQNERIIELLEEIAGGDSDTSIW